MEEVTQAPLIVLNGVQLCAGNLIEMENIAGGHLSFLQGDVALKQ